MGSICCTATVRDESDAESFFDAFINAGKETAYPDLCKGYRYGQGWIRPYTVLFSEILRNKQERILESELRLVTSHGFFVPSFSTIQFVPLGKIRALSEEVCEKYFDFLRYHSLQEAKLHGVSEDDFHLMLRKGYPAGAFTGSFPFDREHALTLPDVEYSAEEKFYKLYRELVQREKELRLDLTPTYQLYVAEYNRSRNRQFYPSFESYITAKKRRDELYHFVDSCVREALALRRAEAETLVANGAPSLLTSSPAVEPAYGPSASVKDATTEPTPVEPASIPSAPPFPQFLG